MPGGMPGSMWWQVLPDVLRSIRTLSMQSTGLSPHIILYKQLPEVLLQRTLMRHTAGEPMLESWGWDEDYPHTMDGYVDVAPMEAIILEWDQICADVQARLDCQDHAMVEAHACYADLAKKDVCYIFAKRDQVLLRAQEMGKAKAHTCGPYLFWRCVWSR